MSEPTDSTSSLSTSEEDLSTCNAEIVSTSNDIVAIKTDKCYDGTLLLVSQGAGHPGFLDGSGRILTGPYAGKRMVDYALEYAAQGWAVFPIRQGTKDGYFGKCPRCNDDSPHFDADAHVNGAEHCAVDHGDNYSLCHGLWAATTDPDAIRAWWTLYPYANIAANVGRSNRVVVDVDIKPTEGKTGDRSVAALEERHGPFPTRLEAVTASGGWHWVYDPADGVDLRSSTGKTHPKTGAKSGLADWVDIKAHGGLVVLAPSIIANKQGKVVGQYRQTNDWTQTPAKLPLWVPQEIERRKAEGRRTPLSSIPSPRDGEDADHDEAMAHVHDLADQVATMTKGGRNELLRDNSGHAFRMAEAGQISHSDVEFIFQQAGEASGLDSGEVRRTLGNSRRWAVGKARAWKAAFSSESLLREYAGYMTPALRKSLFREDEMIEGGNGMIAEPVAQMKTTDATGPLEFIIPRPSALTTPEQIRAHHEVRSVKGVQPFDIGPCPLPDDELEWTLCVAVTPSSGWCRNRLDEMCRDIRARGEEALREHSAEVQRWNLPTYDQGAEGPGYEAWAALVSAAEDFGMDREEAGRIADTDTGAKNAIEVAKQWRDVHPDEIRNLATNVKKWLGDRYGLSDDDYDPYDRITNEDVQRGEGAEEVVVGLGEALGQELLKRQAIIEASRIEAKKAELDPAYIPSYEVRAYESILGREKAQKRRAEELRVEEPEEDYGAIFDRLASGDKVDRRPTFGYLCDDSCGLFYAGTTNGLYGRSGIGKSIIQARLQVEAMRDGKNVVHWEFDNNSDEMIISRLFDAGATRDQIVTQLKIVRSVEEMERKVSSDFKENVGIVTLDAITPAITALGGEVNHPSGTDLVMRTLMQPFTLRGAVGFFLGHVGHENQDRMAGSNRMFAAVQGALYNAEPVVKPAIGVKGLVKLVLKKDNQGHAGETDKLAAYVTYDSTSGDGKVQTIFSRERTAVDLQGEQDAMEAEKTEKAEKTSDEEIKILWKALSKSDAALSANDLYVLLQDRADAMPDKRIRSRLDKMLKDGLVFVDTTANQLPASSSGGKPPKRFRAAVVPGMSAED
jgi:hypothetical protein